MSNIVPGSFSPGPLVSPWLFWSPLCQCHSSVSSPLTVSPSSGARATWVSRTGHSAYSDPLNPVRAERWHKLGQRDPTQGSYWSVFPLGSQGECEVTGEITCPRLSPIELTFPRLMMRAVGSCGCGNECVSGNVCVRGGVTAIKLRWGGDRQGTKVSKEKTRVIKLKNHVSSRNLFLCQDRKSSNILLHSST